MINEVLYMQNRLFRMFCEQTGINAADADKLFNELSIWSYIEDCYDVLHLGGDQQALDDILKIVQHNGVAV